MPFLDLLQNPLFWLGLLCVLVLVGVGVLVWSFRVADNNRPPPFTPQLFFSADGQMVFQMKEGNGVEAWNVSTQESLGLIPEWFLGLSQQGHAVLTRSLFLGKVHVWDVEAATHRPATPADANLFALSQRAILKFAGSTITVRDALGQRPVFTLQVAGSQCQALVKASTGPYLAARYDAQKAEYGHHWWHFFDLEQGVEVGPRQTIDGHNFSEPHFNGVLVGAAKSGALYYQLPTGTPLPTLPRQSTSACLHPQKPEIAAVALQNKVQVFNWQTEAVQTICPAPGKVLEVAFSPDGKRLAALWQKPGDEDKVIEGVSVWTIRESLQVLS